MSSESPDIVIYDVNGLPMAVQNATAIPASTSALIMAGSDGANSRYILLDSSGCLIVVGAGTAGAPNGGVITIQGITGGTAVATSNLSIGPTGSAIPLDATMVGGSDGTNLIAMTMKDASTVPLATDPALVVNISPNGKTPGGLVDSFGPQVSAVITDLYGNNSMPTNPILEKIALDLEMLLAQMGVGSGSTVQSVQIVNGNSVPVAVKPPRSHALLTDTSQVVQVSPLQTPIPVQSAPQGATSYLYKGYVTPSTSFQFVGQSENEVFANAAAPSIVSNSALDTIAGTGCHRVLIQYYDQNLVGPYFVTVNLNGVTAVNITNLPAPMCYVDQIYGIEFGSTYQNQGNVVLWSGAGGTGTAIGQINSGDTQTFYTRHYIPAGVTSYITSMTLSLSVAGICTAFIGCTPNMNSGIAGNQNIGWQHNITGFIGGNQGFQYTFPTPLVVTGPSRFYMQGNASITAGVMYGTMSFYDLPSNLNIYPGNPLIPGVQTFPTQMSIL